MPINGLLIDANMSFTMSSSLNGAIDSFMSDMATNIKPNPAIASPMLLSFLSFVRRQKNVPRRATTGAKAPTSNAMS